MNKYLGKLICFALGKHKERKLTRAEIATTTSPERLLTAHRVRICSRCSAERLTKQNRRLRVGSKP